MTDIKLGFLFLLLTIVLSSCDRRPPYEELVQGQWVIDAALRKGKPTNTLNGLYFTFKNDSVFSNMESIPNNIYVIQSDTISISADNPLTFHIESIDSNHMHLNGWIQNTHFILKFTKTKHHGD
ncbi:hypothetical protein [Membranihabitans marinus]|uniref:hypothetical protein n=1 Tax=Membranihabitans marinus TaxID=1227546 RepID=UPI001F444993|nr:hypothetical protein [Membranihabitans marinus]